MHLPPPDDAAVQALWNDFLESHPRLPDAADPPTAEQFGDTPALADELLGLVLAGRKRATACLGVEFALEGARLPRIGDHWIACDGAGVPRVVLRSVELRIGSIDSVDDAFARDEGEGDLTRESWLREHRAYWLRVAPVQGFIWDDGLEVLFERFRVVWPPGPAD